MFPLLYEPLPLRKSTAIGNFADAFDLLHRYGNLTSGRFKLERLDDTTFFAADHPMDLTRIFVDRQVTKSAERRLQSDGAGNTWTVAKFTAPVPLESEISACGVGKLNPRTGVLIDNAADIAEDILRIAGRSHPTWWDDLRAESAAAGLRLAGSLMGGGKSIAAEIDAPLGSAGAIWAPGFARLYPTTEIGDFVPELSVDVVKNLRPVRDVANTCDILQLSFDPDVARDTPQRSIELTANPMRFGGVVREEAFPWVRTAGDAVSIGTRFLQWFAGRRISVEFDCEDLSVRPGQWRKLVQHPDWVIPGQDAIGMILSRDASPGDDSVFCRGEFLIEVPSVMVTATSVALPVTRDASVEVGTSAAGVTLTFRDKDGRLVVGAQVSLNNGPAKKTGADGTVTFPGIKRSVPPERPKKYRLATLAPGKIPTVQTIEL